MLEKIKAALLYSPEILEGGYIVLAPYIGQRCEGKDSLDSGHYCR